MIDFHTHPLLVREMYELEPDLPRIAAEVFHIGNNPQPLETFLLETRTSPASSAPSSSLLDARTAAAVRSIRTSSSPSCAAARIASSASPAWTPTTRTRPTSSSGR